MKRGAQTSLNAAGFTIVEVIIVLAVTGVLFVAIAGTWFGRQHKTEFQTAAQDLRSHIQQVISDTQNGYYPDTGSVSCTGNTAITTVSDTGQGTNSACVFLGKVIQFGFKGTGNEQYRTYAVAAKNIPADINNGTIAQMRPRVIAPAASTPDAPDISEIGTMMNGLTLAGAKVGTTSCLGIAIGFLANPATVKNAVYTGGSQQFSAYPICEAVNIGAQRNATVIAANRIDSGIPTADTSQPATICFKSGGTNQFAIITIGNNGSNLTAQLAISDTNTCA